MPDSDRTGMIGQMLNREAPAVGIRGTGTACCFDDPVHHPDGFKDRQHQTVYDCPVGGPVKNTLLRRLVESSTTVGPSGSESSRRIVEEPRR